MRTTLGERRAPVERACGRKETLHGEADLPLHSHNRAGDSIPNAEPSPDTLAFSSVFWWAGVVFILYLLSTGPVVKLALEDKIPREASEKIYAPLVWLCDTPVGEQVVRPGLMWYGEKIWRWEFPNYK